MKIIAHRGNVEGPNDIKENSPDYIDNAISLGYDVEIDLRFQDHYFYLGHDKPEHKVSMLWLVKRKDNLWIHCKDFKSLDVLTNSPVDFNYFWHQEDNYTLTSHNIIWTYPNKQYSEKSVIVMPELSSLKFESLKDINCHGICTDYARLVLESISK